MVFIISISVQWCYQFWSFVGNFASWVCFMEVCAARTFLGFGKVVWYRHVQVQVHELQLHELQLHSIYMQYLLPAAVTLLNARR